MMETLKCEAGHEWTREKRAGRKPAWCPQHRSSVPVVSEVELVKVVEAEAKAGSLRAAIWLLEHQWPEKWGPIAKPREQGDGSGTESESESESEADPFAQLDELAVRREASG